MRYLHIVALVIMGGMATIQAQNQTYYQEFKNFKKNYPDKLVFDNSNPFISSDLKDLRGDIEAYKGLPDDKNVVRNWAGFIMIKPDTMPKLYAFIDTLCKEHQIKTPTIFIHTSKGLFNAFALKLFRSNGAIVIGQGLLSQASDAALEGVLAHELGHIKYNHSNKTLGLMMPFFIGSCIYANIIVARHRMNILQAYAGGCVAGIMTSIISSFIIGKRFEKEADEFAYKNAQKGKGLMEFFELLQKKEQMAQEELDATLALIEANKDNLTPADYATLKNRYTQVRRANSFVKGLRWFYHHTPFGAHPSNEDRIEAIREYWDTQENPV